MSSGDYLIHHKTQATLEHFWKAVHIWNDNPHVVNRRLCGSICLLSCKILNPEEDNSILISKIRNIKFPDVTSLENKHILQHLINIGIEVETTYNVSDVGVLIYFKKLLPRNCDRFQPCLELVVKDTRNNEAIFVGLNHECEVPNLIPCFPYSLCYEKEKKEIILKSKNVSDIADSSVEWLKEHLFLKIVKWAESADTENESNVKSSLSLIDIVKYNELYQHLKKKYGIEMVQIWPENTDPLKFVYEDVAIATYLLLLWEQERLKRGMPDNYQTFVDLGCGNGLLVHILNSEGHKGFGIDVRKRTIWDLYPDSTKLQVRSIIPSAESLFPEADWLIGNHSDELTPWIPVIAARSSYKCRFFLLPCCCYELNGQKYQRSDSSRSQYMDYLDYIFQWSEACGFSTKIDRLRIPSTKRICLVGCDRTYTKDDSMKMDEKIKKIIDSKTKKIVEAVDSKQSDSCTEIAAVPKVTWIEDFKVRLSEEKVRNCTRLQKDLVEEIISLTTNHLLNKHRPVKICNSKCEDRMWNAGGIVLIGELASVIPREQLKELKNECGGLQTLLKNNGHIFHVENGRVQLKMPSLQPLQKKKSPPSKKLYSRDTSRKVFKRHKPCWFHFNHPDGCPLSDEECSYKHECS